MKNWDPTDAHDWKAKNRIQKICHSMGIHGRFDRDIMIDRRNFSVWTEVPDHVTGISELFQLFMCFKPDFSAKTTEHPYLAIIELDGDFHYSTGKGVKQTRLRNQAYDNAGIRYTAFYTGKKGFAKPLSEYTDEEIKRQILEYL